MVSVRRGVTTLARDLAATFILAGNDMISVHRGCDDRIRQSPRLRRPVTRFARLHGPSPASLIYVKGVLASECLLRVISGHLQSKKACPLYPRKQTFAVTVGTSAKCQ